MNDFNRTPPAPGTTTPTQAPATIQQATPGAGGSLNDDGLDPRKFLALSPLEQLDKLEADGRALRAYEKARRKADTELNANATKKVTP